MPLLTDYDWRTKYDPDDGSLIGQFYLTALACAQRYDRTTGYFSAMALAIAARGGRVPGLGARVNSGNPNGSRRLSRNCAASWAESAFTHTVASRWSRFR